MNALAMARGRERAARERRRAACARVRAFKRWSKAHASAVMAGRGMPVPIPEIPTDNDYAIWRQTR